MAHNLEIQNDRASIAYAGATPWHKLGQPIAEAFDSRTALEQAGLDFTVEKVPLRTIDSETVIPDHFAIRRTDTLNTLGVVGNFYRPCQNTDAFAFFDGVFGADKARYECAGVLGKGERVWLLAKLPGDFVIQGDDVIGKYLLLTNNHDGTESVRARFTPIRVVCQNTLNAALRESGKQISVMHMGDVKAKLEIAGKLLAAAGVYFKDAEETFRGFSKFRIDEPTRRRYFAQAMTGDATPDMGELTKQMRSNIDRCEMLAETGKGSDLAGVRGTMWGAYNGLSEWVDHVKADADDAGLFYMAAGRGAVIKGRGFEIAKDMLATAN
jgi:phage/plasmid-like protein (TIGR03299 family)